MQFNKHINCVVHTYLYFTKYSVQFLFKVKITKICLYHFLYLCACYYFCSIEPSRLLNLAEQVVQLLPKETVHKWYSPSSYDEKKVPKAAKGVLAEKYNSLHAEASKKLGRSTSRKSVLAARKSGCSTGTLYNLFFIFL